MTRTDPVRLAVVGIGKIARDQHLPAIAGNSRFRVTSAVSRNAAVDGVANFASLSDLLQGGPVVDAVCVCTPPQVRFDIAWQALRAGKHVLLEKPPGATLSEVETLRQLAERQGLTLYSTWHSRHAVGVEPARAWLSARKIKRVAVVWKEDVRRWHPNQAWIWQAGNVGVFDPGINALSILTRIMPHGIHIARAELEFPSNRQTPIAAKLQFADPFGADISAEFDWRHEGHQTWDIDVETEDGHLYLSEGGGKLSVDGTLVAEGPDGEYAAIYSRFAELLAAGRSDVDVSPLRHVADAFLMGRRRITDAFHE